MTEIPDGMVGYILLDLLLNTIQLITLFGIYLSIRSSCTQMTQAIDMMLDLTERSKPR
jgi:hypothetical protein